MKTVDSFNFSGKRALIRVDFNVPLNDGFEITDDSRIQAALPTIKKVLSDGGSAVLMSHLGRPDNKPEDKFSLSHICGAIEKAVGTGVKFAEDCVSEKAFEISSNLKPGEILVLNNLRFYKEEKQGDAAFAKKLAQHGDIYVNDAFGTAHRAHASTSIIAENFHDKCFGYLMAKEVENATTLLNNPNRPFTAIVGGAKVSDKILIIENLLNVADSVIIGGGMAYTFKKAQGGSVGNSLCEDDRIETCSRILEDAKKKGVQLLLPADSICADNFSNEANTQVCDSGEIPDGWMGLDAGPKAIDAFSDCLLNSKTILWNGALGVFEMSSFERGTKSVAEAVVEATKNGAYSLIGGGDSSAAVKKFGFQSDVSYVSTGGGALLSFFEGKELPGVSAILSEHSA
jgi:phosphoglycerate kinase